ncbi:unnamed protein product [marine sediment metagenome]|uniref:Uncharacterized protein n=1 Tax=marine sediment metagenome TaxID=412755 RepID=X1DNT9_9ZZZZ
MAKKFKRSIKKRVKRFKKTSVTQAKSLSRLEGDVNLIGRQRSFE